MLSNSTASRAALTSGSIPANSYANRIKHLFAAEAHQQARANYGPHTRDRRVIYTVAEVVKNVPNLAEHFIRQDNPEDQVAATASVDFRCRQKRPRSCHWDDPLRRCDLRKRH